MTDNTAVVPLEQELETDRLDRFVEELVSSGSIDDASKAAAYTDPAAGRMAVGRETVQKRIRAVADRHVKTDLLGLAVKTVKSLMKNGNPPAVQLSAAKMIFAMNGMLDSAADDGKDKPLHEMTPAQLERFITRAQGVIDQGGSPPIINVTPKKGA